MIEWQIIEMMYIYNGDKVDQIENIWMTFIMDKDRDRERERERK